MNSVLREILSFLQELHPIAEELFDFFETRLGRVLITLFLVFLATSINRLMKWKLLVRHNDKEDASRIRARWVRGRNITWIATFVLIVALWSSQITGFLFSVAAVFGAMLVVSKELILCLWGALMISLNKTLRIGSTIEVGKYTGQLTNMGFLSFDMVEIGPSRKQTGRIITLPNSVVFAEPIKNLSTYGAYGIHLIDFYLPTQVDLQAAESLVLKIANEAGKNWFDKAERNFQAIEKSSFVDTPKAQPEVFWASTTEKTLKMTLRFACPLGRRGQLEKVIVKNFWIEYQALNLPHNKDNTPIEEETP